VRPPCQRYTELAANRLKDFCGRDHVDARFASPPQPTALASKPVKHAPTKRRPDLAPTIAELQAAGLTSLRGIAMALNERGISPPLGHKWQATQVRRLLARLAG
jgi:hypothetical protein